MRNFQEYIPTYVHIIHAVKSTRRNKEPQATLLKNNPVATKTFQAASPKALLKRILTSMSTKENVIQRSQTKRNLSTDATK